MEHSNWTPAKKSRLCKNDGQRNVRVSTLGKLRGARREEEERGGRAKSNSGWAGKARENAMKTKKDRRKPSWGALLLLVALLLVPCDGARRSLTGKDAKVEHRTSPRLRRLQTWDWLYKWKYGGGGGGYQSYDPASLEASRSVMPNDRVPYPANDQEFQQREAEAPPPEAPAPVDAPAPPPPADDDAVRDRPPPPPPQAPDEAEEENATAPAPPSDAIPPAAAPEENATASAPAQEEDRASSPFVDPPTGNRVVLTLPPDSVLADALSSGLLSNENVTFAPGAENGQYVATIAPGMESLFLNVTNLLSMLGPEASVDIECRGQGCEISKEENGQFRTDLPRVLSTTGRRRLAQGEPEGGADEIYEIKLGCGPQVLETKVSDGNETSTFSIILEGPGIQDCPPTATNTAVDPKGTEVEKSGAGPDLGGKAAGEEDSFRAQEEAELEKQQQVAGQKEERTTETNLAAIVAPIVAVATAGIVAATIALVVRRRRQMRARDPSHHSQPSLSSSDGLPIASSKWSDNEGALTRHFQPGAEATPPPGKLGENSGALRMFEIGEKRERDGLDELSPDQNTYLSIRNPEGGDVAVAVEVIPQVDYKGKKQMSPEQAAIVQRSLQKYIDDDDIDD